MSELHIAISSGRGNEVLKFTLDELAKYTVEHFADEERLMASIQYPDMAAHKKKHDGLTRQVHELQQKFSDGRLVFSMMVSNFLADWLVHHIKENDFALVQYMNDNPDTQHFSATSG